MTDLPFPTKTRLATADAVIARDSSVLTARVAELAAAGLVRWTVELTPEGMAWVTRARTREFLDKNDELMRRLAAGPGSTSPEPGPECPARSPESGQPCVLADAAATHPAGHESTRVGGTRAVWATTDAERQRWSDSPTLTEIVEFLDPDGKLRAESTKDGTE